MTAPAILENQPDHTPSKPTVRGASSVGSQRDRRFTDTFFDTHRHQVRFPKGRPFTGQREFTSGTDRESIDAGFISSGLQCGEWVCDNPDMGQTREERAETLASAWHAPWLPVSKYFKFNYRRKLITLDYARGLADERAGLDRYYRAAAKMSGANGWGEVKYGVQPSYQITTLLGEPSPHLPIWQAAIAGDPWLLGFVDEPNEQLAKILGLDVHYLEGHRSPDSEYVAVQRGPVAQPIVTPEKVLATPMEELAQMIADASAKAVAAALDARDAKDAAKKKADKDRMAKARAAKESKAGANS